ncbi:MAG: hypothetical protein AB7U63_01515 [Porticoccaceae bacterium]
MVLALPLMGIDPVPCLLAAPLKISLLQNSRCKRFAELQSFARSEVQAMGFAFVSHSPTIEAQSKG